MEDIEPANTSSEAGELTPLLSVLPSEAALEIAKRDTKDAYFAVVCKEAKWMASSSTLTTLALMLEQSFFFVNVMSVSHLGAQELAAMSLSVSSVALIYVAAMVGILSAMNTFCSTSYTASHDKTLVGFHFQRGLIALGTLLLAILPVVWNSERILLALKQDPIIAHLCGSYLHVQTFGILPLFIFEACNCYLRSQEIMHAGTIILSICAPLHWTANFFLVRSSTYGIGFIGAPVVNVMTSWAMCIGIIIYIRHSQALDTWGGWSISAFSNMSAFYKLAIPSVITSYAGYAGFELLVFGASYFGSNQLAGHAIVLNSATILFQTSLGLGYATSSRIGNLIGAGKPRQTRISGDTAFAATFIIGALGTLFLALCGDWWISVYTSDPAVAREAAKLVPIACIFIISDSLDATSISILRGIGRQHISAITYSIGLYCCGVPVAVLLGYVMHWETAGLWWGLCVGVVIASTVQIWYIKCWVNWSDEVRHCLTRLQQNRQVAAEDAT